MEVHTDIELLWCYRDTCSETFWEQQRPILPQNWKDWLGRHLVAARRRLPCIANRMFKKREWKRRRTTNSYAFSIEVILRESALETTHPRYRVLEWLHIYYGGSSMPSSWNTEARCFSTAFQESVPAAASFITYERDTAAVLESAKHLENISIIHKNVFFIDCQTAILVISTNRHTDSTLTLRYWYNISSQVSWIEATKSHSSGSQVTPAWMN